MVTIQQVSEHAGVSSATVSRVINNPDAVKENTKARVLSSMKELGYRHNVIAASLASNKTNTIGYVVPELKGSFFGTMMSGSEEVLRKAHKHMFVVAAHSDEATEKQEIEALLSRRCDALILHVEAVSDDYLIELASQNVPIAIVNRYIKEIEEQCICIDNVLGGYLATKQLLDNGHTNIAYLAGALFKADSINRLEGHKAALAEKGVAFDPHALAEGNFEAHSGQLCIEQLVDNGVSFTAVACANDEMAAGAINALKEYGKRVPEDISVIGFDNVEFARYLTPKLSTIHYPVREIGAMAANWILNQAYGDHQMTMQHILKPHVVERSSIAKLN